MAINDEAVLDIIDYQYLTAEENLKLTIKRPNGRREEELMVSKAYDEDLGIEFATAVFDGLRHCHNRCCFCFVDQLPADMRPSLYEKDDDYRLSFLHGNFVTLTNLRDGDLERIIKWRLSPLYVSVHTTDPQLRTCLMRNSRADQIWRYLKELTEGGISLHVQIVLCPGINNGPHLERTLNDLGKLGPNLASVGIVPVGLTRFRENLLPLRPFTEQEAQECIAQVERWQAYYYQQQGRRLVFLSDEFYLLAGQDFPAYRSYEDFPQTENGVGLARLFLDEFYRLSSFLPSGLEQFRSVIVVTGRLGYPVLKRIMPFWEKVTNLTVKLEAVDNRFFGEGITVTGLLTGQDLQAALGSLLAKAYPPEAREFSRIIIPDVMLRAGTAQFLDDMTVDQLEKHLGVAIKVAPTNARGLIEAVLDKKLKLTKRKVQRSLNLRKA